MSNFITHPFHLVDESPWPLKSSILGLGLTTGLAYWLFFNLYGFFLFNVVMLFFTSMQWWLDVNTEGSKQGLHTKAVETGLRMGMVLFIVTEIFFFLSFFWAFFNNSISPSVELGIQWPPLGVKPFNPVSIPLLNTIILLASGISVTWSHHAILNKDHYVSSLALLVTIGLGVYFTMLQAFEYSLSSFTFSDGSYGSSFFITTGFHGLHVIIGSLFLAVCYCRFFKGHFSPSHHFGFEAAIWYWHFVDVVWLFLYLSIYWWGSMA